MASFVKILTAGGGNVTHMKLSQLNEVPEGTSHVLGKVEPLYLFHRRSLTFIWTAGKTHRVGCHTYSLCHSEHMIVVLMLLLRCVNTGAGAHGCPSATNSETADGCPGILLCLLRYVLTSSVLLVRLISSTLYCITEHDCPLNCIALHFSNSIALNSMRACAITKACMHLCTCSYINAYL